jgi:hypothetical protein
MRRAAFIALASLATLAATRGFSPPGAAAEPRGSEIRQLLREVPVMDGHNDIPWQYRLRAANDPLVLSLPKLTPEPGSTPDPVLANGTWNVPTTQGKLTWDESSAPDLAEYEVRWSPGPTYDVDTEVVIANIAKDAPREYFTTQGLLAIGDVSNFKIYVKTTTGNERGSNTVKITRTT